MVLQKKNRVREFGDFQTPPELASKSVAYLLKHLSFTPQTIIEPTCGRGRFLLAAAEIFPSAKRIIGLDIEAKHLNLLHQDISEKSCADKVSLIHRDFFKFDWDMLIAEVPKPLLIIGNPPWVTNADIGVFRGNNLPKKSNFQKRRGLDAMTGKANFDISESMLVKHLSWLQEYGGCIAVLCKTAVARKILFHIWNTDKLAAFCRIVRIDAMRHFNAAVDACFFMIEASQRRASHDCKCFPSFTAGSPSQVFGFYEGIMLADTLAFHRLRNLAGLDRNYIWRSGVKHDCHKIMELRVDGDALVNGNGIKAVLEDDFVFPLLKSSDLANKRLDHVRFKVIVPQKRVDEEAARIRTTAPRTWQYLLDNGEALDRRGSAVYKNKSRFSVFGIGPYSFSEWKIAISGFYKHLQFQVVGPIHNRPVMLDDTGYFLNCMSRAEAVFLADLLNSEDAHAFFSSMIFWSNKRPITAELLKRLHIGKLAQRLGRESEYIYFVEQINSTSLFKAAG